MAHIYLASSWDDPNFPQVLALLSRAGHIVYDFHEPTESFAWSEIFDPPRFDTGPVSRSGRFPWVERSVMQHPRVVEVFERNLAAMKAADTCVLLRAGGLSAAMTAGWFKGSGRRLIVHLPTNTGNIRPDLMHGLADAITMSDAELLDALKALTLPTKPMSIRAFLADKSFPYVCSISHLAESTGLSRDEVAEESLALVSERRATLRLVVICDCDASVILTGPQQQCHVCSRVVRPEMEPFVEYHFTGVAP